MICAMRPMMICPDRRSCHLCLVRSPAVLLGSVDLEQQPRRWQVDHHTATATRRTPQPVDACFQPVGISQPVQRAQAASKRLRGITQVQPF